MSAPTAPIHLPPLTLLMSDHTTSQLAIDVAEELSLRNASLYVDDFLTPIHEALQSMFDLDWKRDMANPRESNRLMLESLSGEDSERDVIVSLEKWFNETFGEAQLGRMGLKRMKINRELFDYPYLFRDATPKHIQPIIADSSIPRRDILMVFLSSPLGIVVGFPFDIKCLSWTDYTPTVDVVIDAISKAHT
jgi:hypothetical protein